MLVVYYQPIHLILKSVRKRIRKKIKTAESKPNISNLATRTEVTNVENKIPDSKAFVKKSDYAAEISSIKND